MRTSAFPKFNLFNFSSKDTKNRHLDPYINNNLLSWFKIFLRYPYSQDFSIFSSHECETSRAKVFWQDTLYILFLSIYRSWFFTFFYFLVIIKYFKFSTKLNKYTMSLWPFIIFVLINVRKFIINCEFCTKLWEKGKLTVTLRMYCFLHN